MSNFKFAAFGDFMRSNVLIILLLLLFIILRIPSLFEPHWYGDEGIYASVAYALEHGKKLYVNVFDNRLPGIYFLYSLGSTETRLFYIKFMSLLAGLATLLGIYMVGKRLNLKKEAVVALGVGVLLSGTPIWEGNIANTENFFLPLTIWGVFLALSGKKMQLFFSGVLFGLSFLIKFPPIFTCIAVGIFLLTVEKDSIKERLQKIFTLGAGFLTPILVVFSILFFWGNFKEAIQFGLLNNTSYVTSYGSEGITSEMKLIFLAIVLLGTVVFYLQRIISANFFMILLLLFLDYYAVIFSGRKYEHYLQQLIPSVSLLVGYLIWYLKGRSMLLMKLMFVVILLASFMLGSNIFYKGAGVSIHMNIPSYYYEFIAGVKGTSLPNYKLPFKFFNEPGRLQVAKFVQQKYHTKSIFFYTDESWIYDYTQTTPPTFFVASYHQYLVPNGLNRLVQDLIVSQPKVVAVDKKLVVTDQLKKYLQQKYSYDKDDEYFMYYLRSL